MKMGDKQLIIVGDRVLVKQEELQERTDVGLYLPQTVVEKEEVQGGRIILTGPGMPLPQPHDVDDVPWQSVPDQPKYLPMQAQVGDYALFLKKMAMEIKFEGEKYLIIPHNSILALVREDGDGLEGLEDMDDFET
jgi:co-chaperonin GroES (HSP10)